MNTGERIKKLRKGKKMSQTRLAELIGYTDKSSICKIERENVAIPQGKLVAIASIFGVSVDYLLGGEQTSTPDIILSTLKSLYDDGIIELIETYEQLNTAGRKKAVDNIKDLSEIDKYKK